MAHLLGSQNCLESLAIDIGDVHNTITDIFARVGPVRFPSWKYPDKASCDLDMSKLLARYCFTKDEDHTKLSHIILFELLIDRYDRKPYAFGGALHLDISQLCEIPAKFVFTIFRSISLHYVPCVD